MQAIILRELRDRKISLIVYCFAMVATLLMYASLYPSIRDSWQEMQKLYESYPKEIYEAFGIKDLAIDTLEKFLAVEQFSFVWPIAALFFAVSRAGNTLAGEIEKGYIGLYLALPLSRTKLFVAKYTSFIVSLIVFIVFSIFSVIPIARIFNLSVNITYIGKVALISFLFMWAIYAVSLLISALVSERSKVYMIMGGGLITMYIANIVASLKDNFEWLSNFSVFHYYNAQDLLSGSNITSTSLIVFCLTIVIATVLAIIAFNKRDISV